MGWKQMTAAEIPAHVGKRIARSVEDTAHMPDRIIWATADGDSVRGCTRDGRFNLPATHPVYIDPDH